MTAHTRAAWLEIDLAAYRANLRALRDLCRTRLLPVVKANAYGHGMLPIARAALEEGAWGVGVAIPEEGIALREAGVRGRILVLGLWPLEQAEAVVAADLHSTVSTAEAVAALAAAARTLGKRAAVHVKVDTGMCRVGALPASAPALCRAVAETPELELAGVSTHFASADCDTEATCAQLELFRSVVREVREGGAASEPGSRYGCLPVFHAANSAAALWFPGARLDMVRPGLVTYGVPPGERAMPFAPRPVASLHARITQLKWVAPGSRVGYGGTFRAERQTRLAVVPVGYGDGLPWRVAGRAEALVRGQRVPVVGRISMDQVTLDLTDVPEVEIGDVATFLGRQGGESITASNLAGAAGTIPYEILTGLSHRLPRRYVETQLIQ